MIATENMPCPCCMDVAGTKSGWPADRGPRAMLGARDLGDRRSWKLYAASWIDHTYREKRPDGVVYVAEPYSHGEGDERLDKQAREDLRFLRGIGYQVRVSDAGKHAPGTVRIAIRPPPDETARRRDLLKIKRRRHPGTVVIAPSRGRRMFARRSRRSPACP